MTSQLLSAGLPEADATALETLTDNLRARHHQAVSAVLAYGSCVRSGEIFEGLLDLYLIVDDYQSAHNSSLSAAANWLLPPNVYYAQVDQGERVLRCKYAVVSMSDFTSHNGQGSFESYFWGRFAQPIGFVWLRDDNIEQQLQSVMTAAAQQLLRVSLPVLPAEGEINQMWADALALSYSSELRTERAGRSDELADYAREHFADLVSAISIKGLSIDQDRQRYRFACSKLRRVLSGLAWPLRRVHGKLRSVMRLVKALFTFAGGLDYIAWKLERHSGQTVIIPDRVRRYPLLFAWGFFWGLYRQGVFK